MGWIIGVGVSKIKGHVFIDSYLQVTHSSMTIPNYTLIWTL
jgi:hypothetical protein